MGCAMGTVRYILFFFNFLLALAGLGILIVGVMTAHSKGATINDITHGQLSTPAIVFSVVGACVFLFAFFGCCGALRENHCMICTYAVLLLTLFLLQVAVAVLAYTYEGQTQDLVAKALKDTFEKYKNTTDAHEFVDKLQAEVQCCGSTDPQTPWTALGMTPPLSCYPNNDNTKFAHYSSGCIPTLVDLVRSALTTIGRIAIAVGIVEVVGIVFALCLANSIRRSELRGYA